MDRGRSIIESVDYIWVTMSQYEYDTILIPLQREYTVSILPLHR